MRKDPLARFADAQKVMKKALETGGLCVELDTHKEAVAFRFNLYKFLKAYRKAHDSCPYDVFSIPVPAPDENKIYIKPTAPRAIKKLYTLDGQEIDESAPTAEPEKPLTGRQRITQRFREIYSTWGYGQIRTHIKAQIARREMFEEMSTRELEEHSGDSAAGSIAAAVERLMELSKNRRQDQALEAEAAEWLTAERKRRDAELLRRMQAAPSAKEDVTAFDLTKDLL